MTKTIFSFLIIAFAAFHFSAKAQIVFSKEYGGQYDEEGRWMEQLPDSGYIMTGMTETFNHGQADVWLVRADAYGNALWSKSYGGTGWDYGNMVKRTNDHGFIIAGFTTSYGAGHEDGWLVKTDSNGIMQWNKLFGDTGDQELNAVIPTTDGGYAAVGLSHGSSTAYFDILFVKVDSAGHQLWSRNIGGGAYDRGNAVQQTSDGGYIITGQTYSYGNFDGDFYLVKTNSSGIVQWQKTYGYSGIEDAHYLQITPDGGFALVGDADSLPGGFGEADIWLVRTDSTGDTLWTRDYGGTKRDGGKTVENTSDGGFILAGITRSFTTPISPDPNFYLLKTDRAGIVEWSNYRYGSAYHDHAYRGIQTSDGGYAEFGYFRDAATFQNFALVKLGPDGGVAKDLAIDNFIAPLLTVCRSNQVPVSITLTNYGTNNEFDIPVTVEISNVNGLTTFHDTLFGSLLPSTSAVLLFDSTFNFTTIGNYTLSAYIQHRPSDISYSNDTNVIEIAVLPPTADPVTASGVSCTPASMTLRAIPASGSDSLFWYGNSSGNGMVSTGFSYTTPVLNSDTSYYVQAVKGKGDKVGAVSNAIGTFGSNNNGFLKFDSYKEFKLISVRVYAPTSGFRTIELRNNAGIVLQSFTDSLPSGENRVYLNFDVPVENDLQLGLGAGSGSLIRNNVGVSFPYSVSHTVEIKNSSTGSSFYYYFYDWYVFVPYENCGSNRVPVHAMIGSGATSAFDRSRCGNGSIVLSANSPLSLQWYAAATGGSALGSGSSYTTPALSVTTTYYLQVASCSGRIPVQAIINPISAAPVPTGGVHCGPGMVVLTATASDTVYWYDAASGGNHTGTGTSFSTPYLNQSTTYYVVAGSVCPSTAVPVIATINAASPPVVNGMNACGPASVTLTATSPDSVTWFDVPVGGIALDTTYSFVTPVLSQSVTYYAQALSSCLSPRVPVLAEITTVNSPVATPASRCGPGSVVISAVAIDSISWWSDSTGGTLIGTGINYTTPVILTTTDYFAQASHGGCTSVRIPVTAEILTTPPPQASPWANCGPGSITLNAFSVDSISWYDAPTGGNLLGTGSVYQTPILNSTTTFYAEAGLSCPSLRTPVEAIIATMPADPVTTDSSRCGAGSVELLAISLDPITWYDSPGGLVLGTGSSFTTPAISTTTVYYVTAGIPGCESNPVTAIARIDSVPLDPIAIDTGNCGAALLNLRAISTDSLTWYDSSSGGNIITTGNQYQFFFISTTTYYVEASNAHCLSNKIPVTAFIWTPPTIDLGPDTTITSGQSLILDAGVGFNTYLWNTNDTTQTIPVSSTGTYSVLVHDTNNCSAGDSILVNVTVGIHELNEDQVLEIYPNPSSGLIRIIIKNQLPAMEICISDAIGRILFRESTSNSKAYQRTLDLDCFSKGIYFLRLINAEQNITRSFILN